MGKSTISTGPFSSSQTVNVYQAGYIIESYPIFNDDIPLIFPSLNHIPSYPTISPLYSHYPIGIPLDHRSGPGLPPRAVPLHLCDEKRKTAGKGTDVHKIEYEKQIIPQWMQTNWTPGNIEDMIYIYIFGYIYIYIYIWIYIYIFGYIYIYIHTILETLAYKSTFCWDYFMFRN